MCIICSAQALRLRSLEKINVMKQGIKTGADSQYNKMTEMPVARLIISLGIPTTVSILIINVYNMADSCFVSSSFLSYDDSVFKKMPKIKNAIEAENKSFYRIFYCHCSLSQRTHYLSGYFWFAEKTSATSLMVI